MSASVAPGSPIPLERIRARLARLYGPEQSGPLADQVAALIEREQKPPRPGWSEHDALLITYGDSISSRGQPPLATLDRFVRDHLEGAISCVHILPFFPFSSDDGFAVVDYRAVNPILGDWDDVERLAEDVGLMADLVLNHVSSRSLWFKQFLGNQAPGRDCFIEAPSDSDVSGVVRPRTHPLLVTFDTEEGPKNVWATFSDDQIDLNFKNPYVLLEMLATLLYYVRMGARIVRLDAVAFLWKELGTSCIHLPETHEVVKLMRDVTDAAAPGTILVTETNVPHAENVSYFGQRDEAHMVYQFPLPPLLLHALHTGSSHYLTEWAAALEPPPAGCTFLNFTASHDGIGMRPIEGLLPQPDIDALVHGIGRFGGYTSARDLGGGRRAVYELNITYYDALRGTERGPDGHQVARFLSSQLITLALQGIPAVYVHSLLATPCDHEAVDQTGRLRAVNRRRWALADVVERIEDPHHEAHHVFAGITRALRIRAEHAAFHPDAPQAVHRMGDSLFVIERGPFGQHGSHILVVANLTDRFQTVAFPGKLPLGPRSRHLLADLPVDIEGRRLELARYQVAWIELGSPELGVS